MSRTVQTNRRGFVMVQALVVIAGLLALMALLVANQRVSMNALQTQLRTRRAEIAARSGLAVAVATLQDANPNLVTQNDAWATLGTSGGDSFELGPNATYRIQILDAGARLNLNIITELQMQQMQLTQEQTDSLQDWREATVAPRPQGAKDEYYNTLPQPYNAKLGRITTLNELLLVKGFTANVLYGDLQQSGVMTTATPPQDADGNALPLADLLTAESGMPNTRADGTARTNISQGNLNPNALISLGIDPGTADTIASNGPYSTWTQLLQTPGLSPIAAQRLLDDITVVPLNRLEGKINVNTAPQWVLETSLGLTPDIAAGIISRQSSGGFQSLGELATVPGLTGLQLAQAADQVGVGSDTWIVRVYGASGGVGVALEAVVGLRNQRAQVITVERLNNTSVPRWWNWPDETTTVEGSSGAGSSTTP